MFATKFKYSVHKEGVRFIIIACAINIALFLVLSKIFSILFAIVPIFVAYFFRNPVRVVPIGDHYIVSPADGIVSCIKFDEAPKAFGIGDDKRFCVSVFLSIFDVHINRIPTTGKIDNVIYTPGKFLNASLDKSSVFNERNTLTMTTSYGGHSMAFTQIAGIIARRIVCYGFRGQDVKVGRIFGMIRFGSRCDIWLPVGMSPNVAVGQRMVAGETIICDMSRVGAHEINGESV